MPRSFVVVFVVALATWALLGMLVSDAVGNHVTCGDVITTDTTLSALPSQVRPRVPPLEWVDGEFLAAKVPAAQAR